MLHLAVAEGGPPSVRLLGRRHIQGGMASDGRRKRRAAVLPDSMTGLQGS